MPSANCIIGGPCIKFPLWWGIHPEGDINSIARKNVVASDDVHARIPTHSDSNYKIQKIFFNERIFF